jgi:hypothetical protein
MGVASLQESEYGGAGTNTVGAFFFCARFHLLTVSRNILSDIDYLHELLYRIISRLKDKGKCFREICEHLHEYDGTQPGRFNACHAERQRALLAYKHQFAREELVNNVDLLGLSLVHSPQRLKWATILASTSCKTPEEDCSRKRIKRPLFVLVSADLWWHPQMQSSSDNQNSGVCSLVENGRAHSARTKGDSWAKQAHSCPSLLLLFSPHRCI